MNERDEELKLIDKQLKKIKGYKRKFYSFTNGGDAFYSKLGLVAGGLLALKSIFLPSFVPLYHTLEMVAGFGTLALVGINFLLHKVRTKKADALISKIDGADELFEILGVKHRDIKLDLLGGYLTFKKAMIKYGHNPEPAAFVKYLEFKQDYLKSIMIDTEHNKKKAKEFIDETMGPQYKKVVKEKMKESKKKDGEVVFRQFAYPDNNKVDQMELAYYSDFLRLKNNVKNNYLDYLDQTGGTWADSLTFSTRISLLNQQAIFNEKFENAGYEVTAKDFEDYVTYRATCISDAIDMFKQNPLNYQERMNEKYGNSFWQTVSDPVINKITSDKRYHKTGEVTCDSYTMYDMDIATAYYNINTYFKISEEQNVQKILDDNNIEIQKEDQVKVFTTKEEDLILDDLASQEVNHEEPIVLRVEEAQMPSFQYKQEVEKDDTEELTIDVKQRNNLFDYYNQYTPREQPKKQQDNDMEMGMSR